ncbi:MAG: serine/threonine protein kinase, partial [Acidobacteria bacterium]|nr:serine/threonine protein kinase [Acidobacteriota bacterium]
MHSSTRCPRCSSTRSPEDLDRGLCPRCLLGVALSLPLRKSAQPRAKVGETQEAPGDRVGPFVLLEFLGQGGMGVVYLAEQTEPIQRRVALKLIKLGMDTREVIARFEGERRALALMNHPHIASVHDAGITREGRPYFVMPYVAGVPITAFCDSQRMRLSGRLRLFMQACSAIQHAHEKGIIHRDIKPSNVLVSEVDGKPSVTVIDFGIAKATDRHRAEPALLTSEGVLVGTPEYMSPEQIASGGRDVDTRTDVYALGLLLYEILVGVLPFDSGDRGRADVDEIRRRIVSQELPRPSTQLSLLPENGTESARNRRTDPASLRRALRGDLDWIVMKALEKDRARRYPSAHELA